MRIKITREEFSDPGVVLFSIDGRLDIHSLETFRHTLQEEADQGNFQVILNLENVSFIISTYVGLILNFQKKATAHGGDLKLSSLTPDVKGIFELMGITNLVKIFDSREEAIAACK